MTAYSVTLGANATSTYTNYGFNSFCKGPDGKYYGVKADGLYELVGDTDNGTAIASTVDYGDLNFKSAALKIITEMYVVTDAAEPLLATVNGYEYEARRASTEMQTQRVDTGKGLRATFFSVKIQNQGGADFSIESLEARATETVRRI